MDIIDLMKTLTRIEIYDQGVVYKCHDNDTIDETIAISGVGVCKS